MKAHIVSPSAPSTHTPERAAQFEAGLKTLEALGVECQVMPHARSSVSFVADTTENRIKDLGDAYKEEGEVVIAANGGWNAGDLIGGMEWEAIRANPKPLCGFSDITVLLNAAYAATHQVQIHGPMVTWGFHNNDELTNECFLKVVKENS